MTQAPSAPPQATAHPGRPAAGASGPSRRGEASTMALWQRHPGVRTDGDLTLGERAADRMRNGMGSWQFVFAALGFLGLWMAYNGRRGFDPYPFILLNLLLSCLAAMQGAILLIAAKRSDQISSELAQHDYEADVASRELLTELHANFAVLQQQHADQGRQLTELLARGGAS